MQMGGREPMEREVALARMLMRVQQQAQQTQPAAMPAEVAQQPGPVGSPADPYAAIRNLQPVMGEDTITEGDSGVSVSPGSWMLDLNALANTPFQSKYNSLVPLGDGSMLATFQRPGMHKHDTFSVQYRQDPATGQWTMDEGSMQNQREKSGARQFWRSVGEGAAVVGTTMLGANALSAAYGLGGASPGLFDKLRNYGGSVMDWAKENPKQARAAVTLAGGALGGLSGGETGGGGSAPVYGPPKQWTSGLTMGGGQSSAPRQRAPAIDYTLPSTGGLSMGAGRFLGRGG
jgi:hypothetical protein